MPLLTLVAIEMQPGPLQPTDKLEPYKKAVLIFSADVSAELASAFSRSELELAK